MKANDPGGQDTASEAQCHHNRGMKSHGDPNGVSPATPTDKTPVLRALVLGRLRVARTRLAGQAALKRCVALWRQKKVLDNGEVAVKSWRHPWSLTNPPEWKQTVRTLAIAPASNTLCPTILFSAPPRRGRAVFVLGIPCWRHVEMGHASYLRLDATSYGPRMGRRHRPSAHRSLSVTECRMCRQSAPCAYVRI